MRKKVYDLKYKNGQALCPKCNHPLEPPILLDDFFYCRNLSCQLIIAGYATRSEEEQKAFDTKIDEHIKQIYADYRREFLSRQAKSNEKRRTQKENPKFECDLNESIRNL
jgi:hypothetical protein